MRTLLAVLLLSFSFGMLSAHAAGAPSPSDSELTRRVKGALNAAIGAPAREIQIVVSDGMVSLQGRVATAAAREAAVIAAGRTPGVRGVAENLSVGAGR